MRQHHQQRKITPQYQEYHQDGELMTEGGVEWEEFEIENITNNEERTIIVHSSGAVITRHENGYKEDNDKKKKKKLVTFYYSIFYFHRLSTKRETREKL